MLGPRSSGTRRSPSPTTTASTGRSSSRTPRRRSACDRSPGPRSRSAGSARVREGWAAAASPPIRARAPRTSRCSWSRGEAMRTSAACSPQPTRDSRPPGKEHRVLLAPTVAVEAVAELSDGLVCLSGCAREGLALRDPDATARLAAAFGRDRFYVELQRPFERGDSRRHAALLALAGASRRGDRRHGQRPRARLPAHAPAGHPGRDPLEHLARRQRARASRKPGVRAAPARGDGRAVRGDRSVSRRALGGDRRATDVRPDEGARLPLSRLRRRPRPCDRAALRDLRPRLRRALRRK